MKRQGEYLAKDLLLGDVVRCFEADPFGWGIVAEIDEEWVSVWRPHLHLDTYRESLTSGREQVALQFEVVLFCKSSTYKLWVDGSRVKQR